MECHTGIDVDAVLDRVFAIDPLDPDTKPEREEAFPFPPLYEEKRKTLAPRSVVTHSTQEGSGPSEAFSDAETLETLPGGLHLIPIAAFMDVPDTDIEWCVDRLFPLSSVSILASPGGYGKSWMLLDLAIECARGGKWLDHFAATPMRVLYIDEESTDRLLRHRLRKMLRAKRLRPEDLDIHFMVGRGFSLSKPESVAQLSQLLQTLQPGLVIIDSLIRVHSADENAAVEMAGVFAPLKGLVRSTGITVVFADHQRKGGATGGNPEMHLRGSSEKLAFIDCLLSVKRDNGALVVEHSKSRFAEPEPAFVVQIEDTQPGTTSVSCVGAASGLKQAAQEDTVVGFLRSAMPAGEWVTRKDLVSAGKKSGVTSAALNQTLPQLVARGVLEREDRKPASGGKQKQAHYRWQEAPEAFQRSDSPETLGNASMELGYSDLQS